ncbi:hypothetical protein N9145_03210 [bacterium]|nr:hypothetical protein [bacterium]
MKNKKIITEVSRIQDIMGIKSIISEQGFWDDLVMLGIKAGKNVDPSLIVKSAADEIVIGGVKVSDELSTLLKKEMKSLTDNTTTLKQSVDEVLQLSKKTDPKVYEKLVDSIYNSEKLYESLGKLVTDADTAIKNLIKEKGLSLQDAYDTVMKDVMVTIKNSNMVPDSLIGKVSKEVADLVKTADETLKVASGKIPEKNSMTLKDGTKVSDVFEVSKWKKVKESLSDEEILILANPKKTFNLEITKRLQELAGIVNERANKIKKIAAARTKTTNTKLYGKLDTQLKKEMETLYKKSNNEFVAMKNYLNDAAAMDPEFNRVWVELIKDTDGGWDFYQLWGKTAKHVPAWAQFWKGIMDDLSSVWKFRGENSVNPITAIKGVEGETATVLRQKIRSNISNLFKSGSKRGFPWGKSKKNYKKLIDKYGAKSAKVAYARDLILTTFKINLVLGMVPVFGGVATGWLYRDDFKACTKELEVGDGNTTREKIESRKNQISKKIEACRFLTDATGLNKWGINWALWYRGIEELDEDKSVFNEIVKEAIPFAGNKIDTDDEGGMFILELLTLDPGFVMNVVNKLVEWEQLLSSPTKQDSFIGGLEAELDGLEDEMGKIENDLNGNGIVKPVENEDF